MAPLVAGCGHGGAAGARHRPGTTDVRGISYSDNTGLSVHTLGAAVEQPVSRHVSVQARTLVDYIAVYRKPYDPGDPDAQSQLTGHVHGVDATTSASALPSGGGLNEKWRVEGLLGAGVEGELGRNPVTAGAQVRASWEPDYVSVSGLARGGVELGQRNTVVGGWIGYGLDSVRPLVPPPGQAGQWPATHDRWNGGLTVSQLLGPALALTAGITATLQRGTLANPYRRAIVRTSLFPEVVPRARDRYLAWLALSLSLGPRVGLHTRLSIYADSWGVTAAIPEVALAVAPARPWLATARYRYYRQGPASFYQAHYHRIEPLLTGDARLGSVQDHMVGGEVRWTPRGDPGGFGALSLLASYDASFLDYLQLVSGTIVSHLAQVALAASY